MFSFKKYKNKIYFFELLIVFFELFIFNILFVNKYENIILIILMIIGITVFFIMKYNIFIHMFFKKTGNEQLKKLELEINNSFFKFQNYYLTPNYIFDLNNFSYVEYDSIICISVNLCLNFNKSGGLITKILIYSNDEKKMIIKSHTIGYEKFLSKIKNKNPNIYFGKMSDYLKIKTIKDSHKI